MRRLRRGLRDECYNSKYVKIKKRILISFWNNALKYGGLIVVGIFTYVALGTNIIANLSSYNDEQIGIVKWLIGGLFGILFFIMLKHDSKPLDYNEKDSSITLDELIREESFFSENNFSTEDWLEEIENSKLIKINGLMYANKPFVLKETWYQAKKEADTFNFEGYSDWRLPTVKELVEIGTNEPLSKEGKYTTEDIYIREEFLHNLPIVQSSYYNNIDFWTSETKTINNSSWFKTDIKHYAFTVNYHSKISEYTKTYSYSSIDSECYVIYVRDI